MKLEVKDYNGEVKIYYRREEDLDKDLAKEIVDVIWEGKESGAHWEVIKDDRPGSRVYRLEFGGEVYYLKKYFPKKFKKRFKNLFRSEEAIRHFKTANKLLKAGIKTACPVLAFKYKQSFLRAESVFLMKEAPGVSLRELVHQTSSLSSKERRQLSLKLGRIWGKLFKGKFLHKDPGLRNFFVAKEGDEFKLRLIDVDNIYSWPILPAKFKVKSLMRFNCYLLREFLASNTSLPSEWERILFFKELARHYSSCNLKKFTRQVNQKVLERLLARGQEDRLEADSYLIKAKKQGEF